MIYPLIYDIHISWWFTHWFIGEFPFDLSLQLLQAPAGGQRKPTDLPCLGRVVENGGWTLKNQTFHGENRGTSRVIVSQNGWWTIDWFKGKKYRKLPYFMGTSMVSCRFSHEKSTHWWWTMEHLIFFWEDFFLFPYDKTDTSQWTMLGMENDDSPVDGTIGDVVYT